MEQSHHPKPVLSLAGVEGEYYMVKQTLERTVPAYRRPTVTDHGDVVELTKGGGDPACLDGRPPNHCPEHIVKVY